MFFSIFFLSDHGGPIDVLVLIDATIFLTWQTFHLSKLVFDIWKHARFGGTEV